MHHSLLYGSVGATQTDVLRLVLGKAAALIGAGTCLGLAGSALLVRLIAKLLFETSPLDPLTFGADIARGSGTGGQLSSSTVGDASRSGGGVAIRVMCRHFAGG
jgi:hypothetical protein